MILSPIKTTFRGFATMAFLAAATLTPPPAIAEEWTGQATLYGWGAGVTGDFTPLTSAPTLSFDKSLTEVLEDLDGAFFATGLARRGDLVLFGDLTYTTSSRAGVVPPGFPAEGELTIRSITVAAGRRFDAADDSTIDLLAGIRAWSVEGSVASPALSVAPESNFVDPIIAIRSLTPLSDRWSVLGYFDVGGFGVGSELTWLGTVTANYQATDNLFVSAGWRHLYLDYEDDGTVFEGAMAGPVIGATYRF